MTADEGGGWRLALIGDPVADSLSPAIQAAALRAAGLRGRYDLWEVPPAALPAALDRIRVGELDGANVTQPYKLAVAAACRSLDGPARELGAVNTVRPDGTGGLVGTNTDVAGISGAVSALGGLPSGATVVILGAGGAARAAVLGCLLWRPAHIVLVGRDPDRVAATRAALPGHPVTAAPWRDDGGGVAWADCGLLVNATPVGLDGGLPRVLDRLPAVARVLDLRYGAQVPDLVAAAAALGLVAGDGREMLLHQGAAAFRWWTGRAADLDAMRAALPPVVIRPGRPR